MTSEIPVNLTASANQIRRQRVVLQLSGAAEKSGLLQLYLFYYLVNGLFDGEEHRLEYLVGTNNIRG